jgi:hypothetical protein
MNHGDGMTVEEAQACYAAACADYDAFVQRARGSLKEAEVAMMESLCPMLHESMGIPEHWATAPAGSTADPAVVTALRELTAYVRRMHRMLELVQAKAALQPRDAVL